MRKMIALTSSSFAAARNAAATESDPIVGSPNAPRYSLSPRWTAPTP